MSNRVKVNEIPEQVWFSEFSKEVVSNFNSYAKENKQARLILALYEEPEDNEALEMDLEEGMYDFIYPESNPYSKELEEMVTEAEKYPRYLGFTLENLDI